MILNVIIINYIRFLKKKVQVHFEVVMKNTVVYEEDTFEFQIGENIR